LKHHRNRKTNITVNQQFNKVKAKKKLKGWLMRQYFDPKLNAESPWYKRSVTEARVLEYVSDPLNRFPLTPAQITDMFICIHAFKKNLKKSERELGPDFGLSKKDIQELETKKTKYQTGESTLKEIGQSLGGLTPTMINKLATSGFDKIRKLTNGIPLDDLEDVADDDLERFIMDCRVNAAIEFATDLITAQGQIRSFVDCLVKKRVMTAHDAKIMEDLEVESLVLLSVKSQGEIVQALLGDICRDNNVFKSYQSAVSKLAFPEKKRGRPRKQQADLL